MGTVDQLPGQILSPVSPGCKTGFHARLGNTGSHSSTQQLLPGVGLGLHTPFWGLTYVPQCKGRGPRTL